MFFLKNVILLPVFGVVVTVKLVDDFLDLLAKFRVEHDFFTLRDSELVLRVVVGVYFFGVKLFKHLVVGFDDEIDVLVVDDESVGVYVHEQLHHFADNVLRSSVLGNVFVRQKSLFCDELPVLLEKSVDFVPDFLAALVEELLVSVRGDALVHLFEDVADFIEFKGVSREQMNDQEEIVRVAKHAFYVVFVNKS